MSMELPPETKEAKPAEVSCDNCVAACCRTGSALILSEIEVTVQRRAMNLKPFAKPKGTPQVYPIHKQQPGSSTAGSGEVVNIQVPKHHGLYLLLADCGNISPGDFRCTNYDKRPGACVTYEVGSDECLAARATFGLDGHENGMSTEIRTEPIEVKVPRYHRY